MAAAAVPITGDEASLASVAAAIGEARIVMLGEPWHGDGGAMRERARLVRHLHDHHGFDVLVFEADFYGLHKAWEAVEAGAAPSEAVAPNVYAFWGATPAMAPLWDYLDASARSDRPMVVAGVDTKVVAPLTAAELPADLRIQLEPVVGGPEAEAAAAILDRLLSPTDGDVVSREEFARLEAAVSRLEQVLRQGDQRRAFWAQMAQSLRRQLSGESRDPGMAENLIWLAMDRYPGRKIIVWAHNNHVLTDKWALYGATGPEVAAAIGRETPRSIGRRTYLGEATRHYFGDRAVYSIAFLSGAGRYSTDIGPALTGGPFDPSATAALSRAGPGTLEAALSARGDASVFLDLRRADCDPEGVFSRVLDYSQLAPLRLDLCKGFDGVLYIDQTFGLQGEDPATAP